MANQSQVALGQAVGNPVIRPAQAPRKTLLETIKEIEKQIEILESGPISGKQEQDLVKLKELLRRALGEQEKLQNQWKVPQQATAKTVVATTSQPVASIGIPATQIPVSSLSAGSIGGAPPSVSKGSPLPTGQEKIATGMATVSEAQVLDKKKLQDLVREVDPNEQLDDDVEEMLLQIADDFIETVVTSSCQLAKHRKSNTLEVKDVQLYLERNWNIWVPGFGGEEIRAYKRPNVTEAHRQRMALIRKTLKK